MNYLLIILISIITVSFIGSSLSSIYKTVLYECKRLQMLTDILSVTLKGTPYEIIYNEIKKDPSKEKDIPKILNEYSFKHLEELKNSLIKVINENDTPKPELQETLKSIDDIINLMSTVDENSSIEYRDQITLEIMNTIKKVNGLNLT